MLTSLSHESRGGLRRPPRSLKQEYQEFLLERIEEYKNTLSREELLRIGDEAVRELEANVQDQYLLTEVLLLEHVDRVIARRLRLPSFQRWRQKHRALRDAQRQPTHWGLDAEHPVVPWAPRLEAGDLALVIGAATLPAALLIAAHDVAVLLLDQELAAVEGAESRAVSEQLAARFESLVVRFGSWLPDVLPSLVVIDPGALASARARDRRSFLTDLQARTRPGGVHIILPGPKGEAVIPLALKGLQGEYDGWQVQRHRRGKGGGFTALKPARQADTRANVSD